MPTSLTVFTPAYNRAYILPKLYESLKVQTDRDFEWIIVDDGSTDNTEALVQEFIADGILNIRYFRQPNGGKHRAINRGVQEARGELFFIVDSDDRLTPDAVEWIKATWDSIPDKSNFAGLSGLRIYPDGSKIGGGPSFSTIDATTLDIRYKHHITGDLAETWRTDLMRQYPFPDIPGEKFCSEGLIWWRFHDAGKLVRYVFKGIYIGEYLTDGLSHNTIKCRMHSPQYAQLIYSEMFHRKQIGWRIRFRHALNYWAFGLNGPDSFGKMIKQIGLFGTLFLIPGWIINRIYRHKIKGI